MNVAPPPDWPRAYDVVVSGHLDPHWAASFGLTLMHDPAGTTTLSGVVTDHAELHGILSRIRDLGIMLVSVAATGPGTTP